MTASYAFLPWVRTGLAGGIRRLDGDPTTAPRPSIDLSVIVSAAGEARPVGATLSLFGPGEVAALNPGAVIRVAPKPGELDAEPNEFPMLEFGEPDLPWRFTPAAAGPGDRLHPWLVLCVLADDEITDSTAATSDGRLAAVTVRDAAALPRLDQSWAWAHVQVDAFDPTTESITTIVDTQPARARSRLLAPRHLKPRTQYTAILVPAFERGRLAGLRQPVPDLVDGLTTAWTSGASAIRLPIYYRWSFQTGDQADFEQLARRLTARVADASTGLFTLDVGTPDPALPPASEHPMTGTGVLTAPTAAASEWPPAERGPYLDALATMLNQPADLLTHAGGEPLVAPPLWARWPAAVDRFDPADGANPAWFHELNADPRRRVAAGLGAEVVRRNDDALMAAAWDQVAGILAANAQMRRAQLAREASVRLLANHLSTLDTDVLVQMTAPLHAHLIATAPPGTPVATASTLHESLRASPIPSGALDGQLRRLRRPTPTPSPPVGAPPVSDSGGLLDRLNRRVVQTRPPVPTSDAMLILTAEAPPGRLPFVDHGAIEVHAVAPRLPKGGGPGDPGGGGPGPGGPPPPPPPRPGQPGSGSWRPGATGAVLGRTGGPIHQPIPVGGDPATDPASAAAVTRFQTAFTELTGVLNAAPIAGPVLVQVDLDRVATTLSTTLDPRVTIADGIRSRLQLAPWVTWQSADPLEPILAAPEFDAPMYAPLAEIGHDWLMPGAGAIPADTVTLVRSDQRFVEAYLAGLSHEMARELLFHEFPTDQRGTYFRQFWDVRGAVTPDGQAIDPETLRDITPIHTWSATSGLGEHTGRTPAAVPDHLVLLVKGELLRRFPNAIVYAVEAVVESGVRTLGTSMRYPIFSGRLDPDLAFFGFDLQPDEARGGATGQGWYFVLAEHPAESRFGLDAADGVTTTKPTSWSDLSWAHTAADPDAVAGLGYLDLNADLPDTTSVVPSPGDPALAWHADHGLGPSGANGSDLAWITLQRPFRVAMHGSDLLVEDSP